MTHGLNVEKFSRVALKLGAVYSWNSVTAGLDKGRAAGIGCTVRTGALSRLVRRNDANFIKAAGGFFVLDRRGRRPVCPG